MSESEEIIPENLKEQVIEIMEDEKGVKELLLNQERELQILRDQQSVLSSWHNALIEDMTELKSYLWENELAQDFLNVFLFNTPSASDFELQTLRKLVRSLSKNQLNKKQIDLLDKWKTLKPIDVSLN